MGLALLDKRVTVFVEVKAVILDRFADSDLSENWSENVVSPLANAVSAM